MEKYNELGRIFKYSPTTTLIVVENQHCYGCYFWDGLDCKSPIRLDCTEFERNDKKSIIFKEVNPNEFKRT